MIAVGEIVRPTGIRGQVIVEPLTEFPDRFTPSSIVYLKKKPRAIKDSTSIKGRWIISLEGITSVEDAAVLRGELLTIPESSLRTLPKREYYQFEVLGMQVFGLSGERLGEISDILETNGNDVYVVARDNKPELLVAAISDFVLQVDVERNCMVVNMSDAKT